MQTLTSPQARREHKQGLIDRLLSLEKQIQHNQHDAKLLADLRGDYRHTMDEYAMYYDDDPAEDMNLQRRAGHE